MRLHFKTYGSGEPLIILHGLFGSLNNWQTMAGRLGGKFQVITVDQRNHGHTAHSAEMDYGLMSDDLLEFLDEHQIESAFLLGHSMGGKTAMQFALSHASRVRSLIVVDIAPRAYKETHDPILDALLALRLESFSNREEVDAALAGNIGDPSVRAFLLTNLRRDETGRFQWKLNLRALKEHYSDLVGGVRTDRVYAGPALFIVGGRSHYVTAADEPLIHKLFPNSIKVSFELAGHWVHVEASDETYNAIVNFLVKERHD